MRQNFDMCRTLNVCHVCLSVTNKLCDITLHMRDASQYFANKDIRIPYFESELSCELRGFYALL